MTLVEVENLSDPEMRRFKVGQPISSREVNYADKSAAVWSPVANKLFGFPWTEAVTVGPAFVDVRKQDWVDWDILTEPLLGLLQEHFEKAFASGRVIEENGEPPQALEDSDPRAIEVKKVLDAVINPQVASHGGAVELVKVVGQEVVIRFSGGCQGCAMSQATLKEGVEVSLMKELPWVKAVLDETDHAAGTQAYY